MLASVPVAEGETFATTVKVTVPPAATVTVVLMFPLPEDESALEPAEATAVQLSEVTPAGRLSVTVWLTAGSCPLFDTVIVYVVLVPGTTEVTPSVFEIARSGCGVTQFSPEGSNCPALIVLSPDLPASISLLPA